MSKKYEVQLTGEEVAMAINAMKIAERSLKSEEPDVFKSIEAKLRKHLPEVSKEVDPIIMFGLS